MAAAVVEAVEVGVRIVVGVVGVERRRRRRCLYRSHIFLVLP